MATSLHPHSDVKTCRKCGEGKTLSAFSAGRAVCKPCRSARELAKYRSNPAPQQVAARRYYAAHRSEARAAQAAYYGENREQLCTKVRHRYQINTYGCVLETPEDIVKNAKDKYRHARALGYRSGLEVRIAKELREAGVEFKFEPCKIPYVAPEKKHTYTPDFFIPGTNIWIETKGYFTSADRSKMKLVRDQHPDKDIRLVFANPNARIGKTGTTTYAMWAEHYGFQWAGKSVPEAWLNMPLKGDAP